MAFYNEDEEEDGAGTGSQASGAQSGAIDGGAPGAAAAAPANAPDKSGNFVGIKSYIDANKPQASKLGDQLATYTGANDAKESVQGLGQKFGEKVTQGSLTGLDTAKDEGLNILNQANTTGSVDATQANRYKEAANAQYKGPDRLIDTNDYMPAYQKITDAQNKADQTKTEQGNQALLRNMSGNPVNYTNGANRFDSYLLNSDENRNKLGAVRDTAGALSGQLSAQEQSAGNAASAAKQKSQVTRDSLKSAMGRYDDPATPEDESSGALGGYANEIKGKLTAAQGVDQALRDRLNTGKITQDDLNKYGLQNQANYGIDLKNYYDGGVATNAGVTSPEDRARYEALLSLGGDGGGMYAGSNPQDFGAYNPTVRTDQFATDVASSKNLYENVQPKQKLNAFLAQMQGPGTDLSGSVYRPLIDLASNPNATPDQIRSALQAVEQQGANVGRDNDYWSQQTELRKYLNETLPQMRNQGLVGQVSPDMPKNADGTVNYGGITAPTGSAGKYQDQPAEEVFDPLAPKKRY